MVASRGIVGRSNAVRWVGARVRRIVLCARGIGMNAGYMGRVRRWVWILLWRCVSASCARRSAVKRRVHG